MAAVFDAFSRVPLVLQVFDRKPGAKDMAHLQKHAAKAFAAPRYVITDLGKEFTGRAFRKAVKRLGAVQRFAAKDSIKATARLERFWRSLKETAGIRALGLPLDRQDLEQRLETALAFYVSFRPHEGLKGATPGEAFLGVEPAHQRPSSRPGDGRGRGRTRPRSRSSTSVRTGAFRSSRPSSSANPFRLTSALPRAQADVCPAASAPPSAHTPNPKLHPLPTSKPGRKPASGALKTPIAGLPGSSAADVPRGPPARRHGRVAVSACHPWLM